MVVFRDGHARTSQPLLAGTPLKGGGKRCALAGGTPLAALVRSGVRPLSLRDYGSCSKKPADAASLFVKAIGSDRNKGSDGWVYKAGNVLGTAGGGGPPGPLGRGRPRAGAPLTGVWCPATTPHQGCPHTLAASGTPGPASRPGRGRP